MIEMTAGIDAACERFQRIAWSWLQSGEITRTGNMLSPLEELCGFNYGFVYLLDVDERTVKIGFSEHPLRRIRELQPAYPNALRLRACFVGDREAERFAHRRFRNLRVRNELFAQHPLIDAYYRNCRSQMRERIRGLHVCGSGCLQADKRLDLRMLSAWLSRAT